MFAAADDCNVDLELEDHKSYKVVVYVINKLLCIHVTDRVVWSLCRSVCHDREPCKNDYSNQNAI